MRRSKIIYLRNLREEKGKVHLCSRSLIFESDKAEIPIYKYFYRYYIEAPYVCKLFIRNSKNKMIKTNTGNMNPVHLHLIIKE